MDKAMHPRMEDMIDEVAKELFVRRVHAATGMKDYELAAIAEECYKKAAIFVNTRPFPIK